MHIETTTALNFDMSGYGMKINYYVIINNTRGTQCKLNDPTVRRGTCIHIFTCYCVTFSFALSHSIHRNMVTMVTTCTNVNGCNIHGISVATDI